MVSSFVVRTLSAVVMLGVVAAALYFNELGLHALLFFCQAASYYEFVLVISQRIKINKPVFWFSFVNSFIFASSYVFNVPHGDILKLVSFLSFLASIMILLFKADVKQLENALMELGALVFITVVVSGLTQFTHAVVIQAPGMMLLSFLLVIINDSFAYFCGKMFGRHKLIQVSPNKTLEGFIGGGVFTILAVEPLKMLVQLKFTISQQQWLIYCYALYVATLGPMGGFFASLIKRTFGVKDFSNLIPGHGGVVDRVDCQIVSCFVLWLMLQIK